MNVRSTQELAGIRDVTDLTNGEVKTIASFVIVNELRNPNAKYLEVGVLAGSTIRFCKQYTKSTQFVGVDLFEDFISDQENTHISGTFRIDDIRKVTGDRVTLIKGSSHNILPTINDKFDFIFIDGNHSYKATLQDFNDAKKLLAPGGQVGFHNCSAHMGPDFEQYVTRDGGPFRVVQEILLDKNWQLIADVDRLKVFAMV